MKKDIKILIAVILFLISAFVGWKCYSILKAKERISETIQKLPSLDFAYLKKGKDLAKNSTIINYFSPGCEHCQYMAKQLALNSNAFKNYSFIMITEASKKSAEDFSHEYDLDTLSFLSIVTDSLGSIHKKFGIRTIPSFFIYKDNILVKSIEGETKIDNLIAAIK